MKNGQRVQVKRIAGLLYRGGFMGEVVGVYRWTGWRRTAAVDCGARCVDFRNEKPSRHLFIVRFEDGEQLPYYRDELHVPHGGWPE